MSTSSRYFGFIKPDGSDEYDITKYNETIDKIDNALTLLRGFNFDNPLSWIDCYKTTEDARVLYEGESYLATVEKIYSTRGGGVMAQRTTFKVSDTEYMEWDNFYGFTYEDVETTHKLMYKFTVHTVYENEQWKKTVERDDV